MIRLCVVWCVNLDMKLSYPTRLTSELLQDNESCLPSEIEVTLAEVARHEVVVDLVDDVTALHAVTNDASQTQSTIGANVLGIRCGVARVDQTESSL